MRFPSRSRTRKKIDFKNLYTFGQAGFSYIYYPNTKPRKKLLPRSDFCHFVGMESYTRLIRFYVPSTNSILIARNFDFHPMKSNRPPGVSSLIYGLALQQAFAEKSKSAEEAGHEEHLKKVHLSIH